MNLMKVLRKFWDDEVLAYRIYGYMEKKAPKDKKPLYRSIASMEKKHAEFYCSSQKPLARSSRSVCV